MTITEEYGDLFESDNEWSLAHCVGSDFIMGRGIAVEFRKKYGNQDWLLKNCKGIGTALLISNEKIDRNVFYLVTKKCSRYSKPTYYDLKSSLDDMFQQALKKKIYKIAMPRIGCGLDGLEWELVKKIIIDTKPVNIDVYIKYM